MDILNLNNFREANICEIDDKPLTTYSSCEPNINSVLTEGILFGFKHFLNDPFSMSIEQESTKLYYEINNSQSMHVYKIRIEKSIV